MASGGRAASGGTGGTGIPARGLRRAAAARNTSAGTYLGECWGATGVWSALCGRGREVELGGVRARGCCSMAFSVRGETVEACAQPAGSEDAGGGLRG